MGRLHAIINSSADIYIPMCINSSFKTRGGRCTVLILTESHAMTLWPMTNIDLSDGRELCTFCPPIEIRGSVRETRFRTESFSAFTVRPLSVRGGTIVSKISVRVLHGNTIFNITFNFAFALSELCKLNLIRGYGEICLFFSFPFDRCIVIFDGRKIFYLILFLMPLTYYLKAIQISHI